MLAVGLGVLLLVVFGTLLRSGLALGAAYALTTLVALPGLVDVLIWIAAAGFAVLQVIACVITLAALVAAGKTQRQFR